MSEFAASATIVAWRLLSTLVLLWLAFFFGRTLRADRTPLIERIARVSAPALSESLRSYTRRLTAIWCGYFLLAALFTLTLGSVWLPWSASAVWIGSFLLFVGEHSVRKLLYPGQSFPGLLQQICDSWHVWRVDEGTSR